LTQEIRDLRNLEKKEVEKEVQVVVVMVRQIE